MLFRHGANVSILIERVFTSFPLEPQPVSKPMLDELKAAHIPGLRPIFKVFVELRLRP